MIDKASSVQSTPPAYATLMPPCPLLQKRQHCAIFLFQSPNRQGTRRQETAWHSGLIQRPISAVDRQAFGCTPTITRTVFLYRGFTCTLCRAPGMKMQPAGTWKQQSYFESPKWHDTMQQNGNNINSSSLFTSWCNIIARPANVLYRAFLRARENFNCPY